MVSDTPEQRLSLFETLTGFFTDGTPVQTVPLKFWHIYSIKSNLHLLFNSHTRLKGSFPSYGFTDIADIDLGNVQDLKKLSHLIRETILAWEPRIKKVVLLDFHRDDKTFAPACLFAVELQNGCVGRFRLVLIGTGGNRVETVGGVG